MPAKQLKNVYVNPQNKLNYSRSVFSWEDTHSTNMLTGYIYPVAVLNCMPGDTVPNKFGFVLQSAPLLGPSLDNVYIDIISVWTPTRLVMADFNEWLGDNDTYAWTLGNNVTFPKINFLYTCRTDAPAASSYKRSRAYYAEHYLAPHLGCRIFRDNGAGVPLTFSTSYGNTLRVANGVSVIPSRVYQLNWNRLFRNENIQNPVLFSKSSTIGGLDIQYQDGLGKLLKANRLKDMFNMARLGPSIQTVDLGLGADLPVITASEHGIITGQDTVFKIANGSTITQAGHLGLTSSGVLGMDTDTSFTIGQGVVPTNLWADLASLTVNSMYYAIMKQKFLNKMSNGRRMVEFYANMFGVMSSNAAYDDPELLSQKRFKVNISRVVATANSTDTDNNTQPLGSQGAFSVTSVGGTLFPEFTATEYGYLMVYAVIRTQESYSSGIDRYLTDGTLLDTYLPVFDHIGEDYVELSELADMPLTNGAKVFGYQEAWYNYRYHVNHVLGILAPGEPMDYWTLARNFDDQGSPFTVNSNFIEQGAGEVDRMMQFPCFIDSAHQDPTHHYDSDGRDLEADTYQWLIQFCLAGNFARTMSKNSEPLLFGSRI